MTGTERGPPQKAFHLQQDKRHHTLFYKGHHINAKHNQKGQENVAEILCTK